MSKRTIKSLYKKELLDVFRDKKTVIMMLVVPLVLYPLLFIVGMQVMSSVSAKLSSQTYRIVLDFDDNDNILRDMFEKASDDEYSFEIVDDISPDNQAVIDEKIDAYIKEKNSDDKTITFEIYYASAITNSSYATDVIQKVLQKYSDYLSGERIMAAGLDVDYILHPVELEYKDISKGEETVGNLLGTIIPFMLVVSLLMGTMYPAIDTTAGERERGTLETMLTLPVSNRELIVSKFLTVATIGVVSAILNIISMCGVGIYMYQLMRTATTEDGAFSMNRFVPAIVIGILCVLAFAVFISAVTMCVCSFAKSYKEANNYITPLTLLIMFASFAGLIPNVELTQKMALIPVTNICLLIKELLAFKIDIGIIVIVLVSNVAYGLIAILLLGKIYNSEAVLFGDVGTEVQIFEKRSNLIKGGVPTLEDMWLVVAITAVMFIYIGSMIQLKLGFYGLLATQLIIAGVPLLAAWYTRKDMRLTFKIKPCRARYLLAGLFMLAGVMLLGMVLTEITSMLFEESASNMNTTMESIMGDSFPATLLVVAAAPAVCEELMFRGYILSSMDRRMKYTNAILISSCLFGLYHMSIVRFFTTALLGAAIAYVVYKSGSIFAGMLMHFINNAISVITMYYPGQVGKIFPFLTMDKPDMMTMLCLFIAGVLLMGCGNVIISKNRHFATDKE